MRYYISISIRRNLRDSRSAELYNSKKQARWELAYFFQIIYVSNAKMRFCKNIEIMLGAFIETKVYYMHGQG